MITTKVRYVMAFLAGAAVAASLAMLWPRNEWGATTWGHSGITRPARINLRTGQVQVSEPWGWRTVVEPKGP